MYSRVSRQFKYLCGTRIRAEISLIPKFDRNQRIHCESVCLLFDGLAALQVEIIKDQRRVARDVLSYVRQLVQQNKPEIINPIMPQCHPDHGRTIDT